MRCFPLKPSKSRLSILSAALAAAALLTTSAQTTIQAASITDIEVLTVMGSTWRFTNCVAIGAPATVVPSLSSPTYDDSTWAQGTGLFGIETTPAEYAPYTFTTPIPNPGAGGPITEYFRTTFNWSSGDPAFVQITTTNYIDDGCVWYLNGVEVARTRIAAGEDCPTLGSNPPAEGNPVANGDILIFPLGVLKTGLNVLVAELHQSGTASSDDVFGMSLTARLPLAPTITDTTQPSNRVVLQLRSSTLTAVALGSPSPTYQWIKDNNNIPDATNSTFIITNMQAGDAGEYYCHIVNAVGSTDTRKAMVQYTQDTNAPTLVGATGSATFDLVTVQFSERVDPNSGTDPFNYSVAGGTVGDLGVTSVDLNGDGASVTLHVTTTMEEAVLYTVTVTSVKDLTLLEENTIAPGSTVQFNSWVTGCGGLLLEVFSPLSTTDNNLNTTLLASPDYPNRPAETHIMPAFDTRTVFSTNDKEGYGGRIRGLFIPLVSGSWVFYLASDDSSRLWLNPNGPSAAGKVLIQEETGCCGTWTAHASAPRNLVAGQGYYIEAIYKEGVGGDYCKVAARLEAEGPPSDNPNGQLPISVNAIAGSMLGFPAAPAGVAGTFTITQQPANVQGSPGIPATFSVATSTDVPLCYQWLRDGADIDGAIGPNYSLTPELGDNGAVFSVRISAAGGAQVVSANATLTVQPDMTPPTVVSATADATGTNVVVTFSENMDMATAETAANYTVDGVAVVSARKTSTTNVALVTAARLDSCASHQLRITGVKDLSLNNISPNPTTVSFRLPGLILLSVGDGHPWRYDQSGVDRGTAWKEVGYDDSGWAQGTAFFGVKNVSPPTNSFNGIPIATWLSLTNANFPTNAVTDNPTYYFRTHFTLPTDPLAVTELRLRPVVDDGVVLYLNGQEIYRLRVTPAEDAFASYLTAGSVGDANYEGPFTLSKAFLVSGDNVLAAELKQHDAASSDAAFGLELIAEIPICGPGLHIARSGPNIVLTWSDATYHLDSSQAPSGAWTRNASATSGFSTPASGAQTFFRLSKP